MSSSCYQKLSEIVCLFLSFSFFLFFCSVQNATPGFVSQCGELPWNNSWRWTSPSQCCVFERCLCWFCLVVTAPSSGNLVAVSLSDAIYALEIIYAFHVNKAAVNLVQTLFVTTFAKYVKDNQVLLGFNNEVESMPMLRMFMKKWKAQAAERQNAWQCKVCIAVD